MSKEEIKLITIEIKILKRKRKLLIDSNKLTKNIEKKARKEWQSGLKDMITTRQLTYSEVGNSIGVSRQTISKWVNMKKVIPKVRAKELSDYLNYKIYE